jgi:UDP-N-acetylmuramoyl-tripeptide--D-alanyl-D-alanine ligase
MEWPPSEIYKLITKTAGISIDSRSIRPGDIFFALKGENFDGNRFATEAIKKGASYAVVDDPTIHSHTKCILVENVLETLQQTGRMHRRRFNIPVIGITGSNGKTTTRELVTAVLEKEHNACSASGNLNNHIGVPLTLLKIRESTEVAVIEMGANHQGEISTLCNIAEPTYGMITNIGKAHLEGFGGYQGVIKAKGELFDYIRDSGGLLFVNADDPLLMKLSEGTSRKTYGSTANAEVAGTLFEDHPGIRGEYTMGGKSHFLESPLYGHYNFMNILAAIAIGSHFKVSPENMKSAIAGYQPDNMRSQIVKTGNNTVYLDAYNANPTSMELAIDAFGKVQAAKKLMILGDMLELGHDSAPEHRKIIELLKHGGWKDVVLVGPEFESAGEHTAYTCFKDHRTAGKWLAKKKPSGYTILVKASRGIQLEKLMDYL